MIPHEGFVYRYTIHGESWYAASLHRENRDSIGIGRDHMEGGCAWEFDISADNLGGPTLKLEMFSDSWKAFRDAPELFEALRQEEPRTLADLREMLDRLGFADATVRVSPYVKKTRPLVDPDTDPHRSNPEPHWRLYSTEDGPEPICVQNFDYYDYDAAKFLTPDAYKTEEAAREGLDRLRELVRRIGG